MADVGNTDVQLRREIAERGRAEEALRESEARLQVLLAQMPAVLWATDADLRFTSVSGGGLTAMDLQPQQMVGRTLFEHFRTEDPAFLPIALHRRALQGGTGSFLLELGGRTVHVQVAPLRDVQGVIRGCLGVGVDITPRRQAEERLWSVMERQAFLLRTIPITLYTARPSGDFGATWVSENVERVTGFPASRFIEDPGCWESRLHPEDRSRVLKDVQAIVDTGTVATECRWQCADGSYRWFLDQAILVRDESGQSKEIIGSWLDITQRKEAEEALDQAKAEAERASRAKSEFLSRASHELRTPLNAILGFGQLLQVEATTPEQRESVEAILKAGRHLLDLINDVLAIAHMDAGRLHLSIEPVSVGETVREALDLLRPLAAQRRVHLPGGEDYRDRYVLADSQRLKQVVLNLLANAIQYNREGGTVSLGCEPAAEGRVRITVSDTGPGIPAEKMDRLFTPFDRLEAEQTGVEGSGLGLALSKRLVEAMGGALGVESVPGQGSAFWVELPGADGPAHGRGRPGETAAQAGTPGKGLTILYLEDNLANLKLIEGVLSRRAGVKLLAAMQGGLGLSLAAEHRPDLILLDLHLPDMHGSYLLARLQAQPETRGIPVVVLSADVTLRQTQRLLAEGARACLKKPLDVPQVFALLDEMLRERQG